MIAPSCSCGQTLNHVCANRIALDGSVVRLWADGSLSDGNVTHGVVASSVAMAAVEAAQWLGVSAEIVRAANRVARSLIANEQRPAQVAAIINVLEGKSVRGRRKSTEALDAQHIRNCRDPWCRVCKQGAASRG